MSTNSQEESVANVPDYPPPPPPSLGPNPVQEPVIDQETVMGQEPTENIGSSVQQASATNQYKIETPSGKKYTVTLADLKVDNAGSSYSPIAPSILKPSPLKPSPKETPKESPEKSIDIKILNALNQVGKPIEKAAGNDEAANKEIDNKNESILAKNKIAIDLINKRAQNIRNVLSMPEKYNGLQQARIKEVLRIISGSPDYKTAIYNDLNNDANIDGMTSKNNKIREVAIALEAGSNLRGNIKIDNNVVNMMGTALLNSLGGPRWGGRSVTRRRHRNNRKSRRYRR